MKNALISFVGINDLGKQQDQLKNDGAILTVFKERKFDEVHLLWNPTKDGKINFYSIAVYIKKEITNRKYCKEDNIHLHSFECENVTDHNEIYPKLLKFCESLPKQRNFTAAIASGTPAMQVCWILLAESGDFALKLIRSNEPKFGKPFVRDVKLGTGLPRIKKMQKEINYWTGEFIKSLPILLLNIKKRIIKIGEINLDLAPVEFVYYRYFIERANTGKDFLKFTDSAIMPDEFYQKIMQYHRESFPAADSNRMDSERAKGISTAVFRSNINKLNKKIKPVLENEKQENYFLIQSEGKRFYKSYGLNLPKNKIKIIN
jgi:hypothetical protein